MRAHRWWTTAGLATVAAVVLFGFLAPSQLGGGTTYAVTSGISMRPLLKDGDLALVRSAPSYHVGQVVLYHSPVLNRPVLHRIIVIQEGRYYFKGDNNSFVDPGYAIRSQLIGAMWIHIPAAGGVLSWFGRPTHAAILAGLAALIVTLAAAGPARRRRRRKGPAARDRVDDPLEPVPSAPTPAYEVVSELVSSGRPGAGTTLTQDSTDSPGHQSGPVEGAEEPVKLVPQIATLNRPSYLDGPGLSLAALVALAVVGTLSLLLGFTRPAMHTTPLAGAFRQAGEFSYTGNLIKPTPVYQDGVVTVGEPIYPSLVSSVTLSFRYTFSSALPHRIKGTISMDALVLSNSDTWQRLTTVKTAVPFVGDHATISATLPLAGLYTLINSLTVQSGVSGTSYSADLKPDVHISGAVGGHPITSSFQPNIPATISPNEIAIALSPAAAPPGAGYSLPAPGDQLAAAVNPMQTGSIPHVVTTTISLARYKVAVPELRIIGYVMAVLTLIMALAHEVLRRRMSHRSDEEVIAKHFNSLIVPVVSLSGLDDRGGIEVQTFTHLARLARFLERPVLFAISGGERVYALDDESIRYLYHPPSLGSQLPDPPALLAGGPSSSVADSQRGTDGSTRLLTRACRLGGVALAIVLVGTLTASFTAGNTVSPSRVGQTANARTIAQLTPASCVALAPTSLLAGSGTFQITTSHTLVLGSLGVDNVTDKGGSNCIVGGAAKDKITVNSSDICVVGPTAGASYMGCTTSP